MNTPLMTFNLCGMFIVLLIRAKNKVQRYFLRRRI